MMTEMIGEAAIGREMTIGEETTAAEDTRDVTNGIAGSTKGTETGTQIGGLAEMTGTIDAEDALIRSGRRGTSANGRGSLRRKSRNLQRCLGQESR
jgi:hypothetical protein